MNNSCHNRKSYRIGFAPAEPRRVGVPPAESRRVRRQTSTDAWTPVLLPRGRHRHVVAGIRTGDTCWSGPARRTSIAGRQYTRFLSNSAFPAFEIALLTRHSSPRRGKAISRYGALPAHDRFRSPIPALEGALLKKGAARKLWLVRTDSWAPKPTYPQNLLSSRISATLCLECWKSKNVIRIEKKLTEISSFLQGGVPH